MISIGVDRSLTDKCEMLKKRIADSANKQFRQRTLIMFNDLVRHSPQWSGDFASNWYVHMDPNHYGYNPNPFQGHTKREDAKKMGDPDRILATINRANSVVVDYAKPLYFINKTPIEFMGDLVYGDRQPYKGANFPDTTKVRGVNLVDGRVALGSYLKAKYV